LDAEREKGGEVDEGEGAEEVAECEDMSDEKSCANPPSFYPQLPANGETAARFL
jgi:hypothetical protein